MRVIRVKQKYRWPGRWPQSQKGEGTPNGGDAFLFKARRKNKMTTQTARDRQLKEAQQSASRAGMKRLVICDGKRHWKAW